MVDLGEVFVDVAYEPDRGGVRPLGENRPAVADDMSCTGEVVVQEGVRVLDAGREVGHGGMRVKGEEGGMR